MPYSKQTWEDDNLSYPVSAERMSHIEDGIYDARGVADEALSSATTAIGALGGLESDIDDLYDEIGELTPPFTGVINVRSYGATGDGATDDTAAVTAAAAAAGASGTLYFPRGTYRFADTITGVRGIRGEGRARTVLQYIGSGTAIRIAVSPGVRSYHGQMESFLLRTSTGGTIGIDAESHSGGLFTHVAVQGFQTGFWLGSTVDDGGCLYNTFLHCEATSCAIGWRITEQSSNENRLIACRTNGATNAAVVIDHGNHNHIISCAFESGDDGVRISGGTSSDGNVVAFTRFEENTGEAITVGSGVRDTLLLFPKVMSTGGTVIDNGTRTKYLPGLPGTGHTVVQRSRNMTGSDTVPAFAARDTYPDAGNPTTMEIQNERFTGKFLSGVRGGTERFFINSEGVIKPFHAAGGSLPSPSRAGAGGMAYNTTTNRPVWSDGSAWRYADGTAI